MKIIGLTGGIASGKSTVSRMLEALGAIIIDADRIAREIVVPGSEALAEVAEAFGTGVLNPDGTLNRSALARIVFNDPVALKRLNDITHPRIIEAINRRIAALPRQERIAVLDAALLIELRLYSLVDEIWLVCVSPQTQQERLLLRDHMPPADAEKIIRAQLPLSEKMKAATRCIDNNGTLEALRQQVEALWNEQVNP